MKKLSLIFVLLAYLCCTDVARAEEKKIGVTFDVTYVSKYLSKGCAAYGQQGGVFETVDLDFWSTGFGVKVTHRSATAGGYVDKQRFDYRPYYKGVLFEDSSFLTKYNLSVGYEHYYGLDKRSANTTLEWILGVCWPELTGCGVVPSYIVHYETPASSGNSNADVAGWVHRFGLGYDLDVAWLPNPLSLCSEIAYNDGLGGDSKDHDWSNATFGISTKYEVSRDLFFVPGLYQQISMDDSVNKQKDVTYCKLSVKYKF